MTIRPVAIAALLLTLLASPTALATTAPRTFVASTGSDAHPCSLSEPCRSFATAIAKTSSAGEVVVVDSAGYGPVTITQSVSIISPPGIYAGVTLAGIGNAIGISGSGIAVALRGLSINAQGNDGGIYFSQGAQLSIESCEIINASNAGMTVTAPNSRVLIQNTVIRDSQIGVWAFSLAGGMQVSIANSVIANNALDGVRASANAGVVQVTVAHSILTNNGTAFEVVPAAGTNASILADGNTITYSDTVFKFFTSSGIGAIFTAGNNTAGYYGTLVAGGTLSPCCGT